MAIDPITGLEGSSASTKNIEAFPETEGWEDFSSPDTEGQFEGYEDLSKTSLTNEGTDLESLDTYFSANNPSQLDFSDDIIYKSGEGYVDRLKLVQERLGADRFYDGALEDVARMQSAGEQLKNATLRLIPNTAASIIGDAASILDFEDYLNQDAEVGNDITRSMEEFKRKVNEEWFPIYRETPGKVFDMADPAWWFENASGLIESAASFALTGGVVGKGLSALKWINSLRRATGMGFKAGQAVEGVTNALVSSTALNQAEAMRTAINIYDDVYKKALSVSNGDEISSRVKAAEAAAHSININRLNIALNLTSASRFMKNPTIVSEAAKKISKKNTINAMKMEGIQEYAEENVNLVAEKEGKALGEALIEGRDYEGSYRRAINTIGSMEGFEAGFWGFWGGALQTGATEGIVNNMKIHNKNVTDADGNPLYSKTGPKAYVDANLVEQLKERSSAGENLTEEDIDKAVSEFNADSDPRFSISEDGSARLKKAFVEGTESIKELSKNEVQKERVSRNQLKKEHYEEQKKFVDERVAELKKKGQSLFDTVEHGEEMERYHLRLDALNQISDPEVIYDPIKREAMLDVLIDDATKIEDEAKRKEQLEFLEQLVGADTKKVQELKEQQESLLLSQQVHDFAKRGAVPELEAMYESIANMSEDEATKKGYSENYRDKANKALELINDYKKIDDKNRGLYGPIVEKALYDNRVKHRELVKDYNKTKEVERTAVEQQQKDDEGPEIIDVNQIPLSDDEILKAKQDVKKAKKAIDDSNEAYNKLKTKEGAAKHSVNHYKKMFKELTEAKRQINFRSAADDLIRLQEEDKVIFKLNDKEGFMSKEGDRYFFTNEDEITEITIDNISDIKDQIESKEAYKRAKERKEQLKRLEEKTKVFNKFKEALESDLEDIQNSINEKSENIDNINKKLQKTRENLNKLRLDKQNFYEQVEVAPPFSNSTYAIRRDGTIINVDTKEVISPSPMANRVYKFYMENNQDSEYMRAYNESIDKALQEIEEMEVQVEILSDEIKALNDKEEAMYGTLILLDNKQKVLDQGKREFAEQWKDAEEELRNNTEVQDLNKKLLEYSAARRELQADINDLKDLLEEVKLGFEELKDLTPEDVMGMLAEAQNQLKRLDATVEKMKARKEDLTKYAKLFKALSKFNEKLAEAAAKEEAKEKQKDTGPNPTNITADQRSNTNSGKFSYSNGDIDVDQLEYDAIMRKLNAFTSAGDHNKAIATGDENSLRWFEALNKIEDAEKYFVEFITFNRNQELAGATENIDKNVSDEEFADFERSGEVTDERIKIIARKSIIRKVWTDRERAMMSEPDTLSAVEEQIKEFRIHDEVFSKENKAYEAEFGGNGIRMILVDKDGKMVTSDKFGNIGKGDLPLSMTMHSVEGEKNKVAYKGEDGNWYSDFSVKHLIQNKVLNSKGNLYDLSVIEFAIGLEKADPKRNRLPKEYKELTGQEIINKVLSEVHEDIQNTRDDIKKRVADGERVFSPVTEISGGHAVYEKDVDNKKVQKDIVGTFVESIEDIASMTTNSRGEVIITDKSGRTLAVTPDTLSDEDVDVVLRLLNDSLKPRKVKGKDGKTRTVIGSDLSVYDGYDKKTNKERKTKRPIFFSKQLDQNYITDKDGNKILLNPKPAEIENYIYWGKAKEGKSDKYQIYFDKEAKAIFYGSDGVVAFSDIMTDPDFKAFLKTKRYNFNRRMQRISSDEYANNSKKPFKIIRFTKKSEGKDKRKLMLKPIYGEKNLSGYELFILSKLKTNLADSTEGNPNFRQRYITFDSEISPVLKRKQSTNKTRQEAQQKRQSTKAKAAATKRQKVSKEDQAFGAGDTSATDNNKVPGTEGDSEVVDNGYGKEPKDSEAAMKSLQKSLLELRRRKALEESKKKKEEKKEAKKIDEEAPSINLGDDTDSDISEGFDDEGLDPNPPFRIAQEISDELAFFIDDNRQKLVEKGLPLLPSYYAQQFIKSGLAIEPYLDMLEESLDC